jgi:hypothetical protein
MCTAVCGTADTSIHNYQTLPVAPVRSQAHARNVFLLE